MTRNRGQAKCLCSELVTALWTDAFGQRQKRVVNLEEIWSGGAVLQFEEPLRIGTEICIATKGPEFGGTVVACKADFIGHFVKLEFSPGTEWSRQDYEPGHCLDPLSLLAKQELKLKNSQLLEDCTRDLPRPAPLVRD